MVDDCLTTCLVARRWQGAIVSMSSIKRSGECTTSSCVPVGGWRLMAEDSKLVCVFHPRVTSQNVKMVSLAPNE